ncbi:MAG: glycosyltransferase [Candidatus Accumulibacter sp.]|uniref:Glycosyltransferase n=1 Tax=Candidatus Accumulibacter proximus TaxID=2954385 RepID=A0A935PZ52_9PROT|nr:glycosyltransferase [Candidatus Accumulibacter proximus]
MSTSNLKSSQVSLVRRVQQAAWRRLSDSQRQLLWKVLGARHQPNLWDYSTDAQRSSLIAEFARRDDRLRLLWENLGASRQPQLWQHFSDTQRQLLWMALGAYHQPDLWDYSSYEQRSSLVAFFAAGDGRLQLLWENLGADRQPQLWQQLSDSQRSSLLWPAGEPRNAWDSFDSTPWDHPWLSVENLLKFRRFSDAWFDRLLSQPKTLSAHRASHAFVGNMANNLYIRAKVLRRRGARVDVFVHPHDTNLMSQPAWEEYGGVVPDGVTTLADLESAGQLLPEVDGVYRVDAAENSDIRPEDRPKGVSFLDFQRFRAYFFLLPGLKRIAEHDSAFAVQIPYAAMLAGLPYAVSQMGGEIWYEASRDDIHGRLIREAYSRAAFYAFNNPWSLTFARRYALKNLVYLPLLIDGGQYSPGPPSCRGEWRRISGGNFFVMMTSRLDFSYKGSDIALRAFSRFANVTAGARLVATGWGADKEKWERMLQDLGIHDKVLVVPVAGKRKVVEYLRSADCLIDQISLGYYGATALEAMACGTPVLMKLNKEQYDALLPEGCPPVELVNNEDEVYSSLVALHADRDRSKAVGAGLREWFLKTHDNEKWGARYQASLDAVACGRLPSFADTPLEQPLTSEEQAYHQKQLAAAPIFPNYK